MVDEAMRRLLDYDGQRYWLENGWSLRCRVRRIAVSAGTPHGVRYSFTLHDVDGMRLLGFDNAHGVNRRVEFDHRHRFRKTAELVPYEFRDADRLLMDFFGAVESACQVEGVPFDIVDIDEGKDDDEKIDS